MSIVLIPTDFSNDARNAFRYGLAVLGPQHEYILLNAYEEPKTTATSMVSLKDILVEASEDSVREEKKYFEEHYPGIEISTVSEYGDPIYTVTNFARKNEVDLIVMGTAGVTGLQKIFLGSTAAAVIEKATCPVIVVPRGYHLESLKHVLFTADLLNSDEEQLPAVLSDMVRSNQSEITILTVNREGKESGVDKSEKGFALHTAMKGFSHKFEVITNDDIEEAIRSYAHDNNTHLLVTTPRCSTLLQRFLKPSISEELAEHLEIPMLAIH